LKQTKISTENKNMKFIQKILAAIAGLALATSAFAQLDTFGPTRSIIILSPTNLSGSAATGSVTNGVIDTHGFDGIATIDLLMVTNSAGTLTAQIEGATDCTNWTAFSSYALATSTTIIVTNGYYGSTNLTATNVYLLPGVITTPTASTAGWATPFLNPALFTNTAAVTMVSGGYYKIGYNVADAPRYLHIVWTAKGTSVTNVWIGALFTGRRAQSLAQ
jgi:hypothetical protein